MPLNPYLQSIFIFFKKSIKLTLVYYVFAFVIFLLIFNSTDAILLRLDSVQKLVNYPKFFASHKVPINKRKFKLALFYCRKALENKNFFKKVYSQPISPSFTLARIHGMMGFCYYYLDNHKMAIKYFKKVPKHNPVFYWKPYNLGIMAFEQNQYEQAVLYFNKALSLSFKILDELKKSEVIRGEKADMMHSLRQIYFMQAKEVFQKSQNFIVLSNYRSKNYKDTLTNTSNLFHRGDTLDKWFFYYYAALAAKQLKNFPLAISLFRQTIDNNPDIADAYDHLSQCLLETQSESKVKNLLNYTQVLRSQKNYQNPLTKKQTLPNIQLDPWSYLTPPGKENIYLRIYGVDYPKVKL